MATCWTWCWLCGTLGQTAKTNLLCHSQLKGKNHYEAGHCTSLLFSSHGKLLTQQQLRRGTHFTQFQTIMVEGAWWPGRDTRQGTQYNFHSFNPGGLLAPGRSDFLYFHHLPKQPLKLEAMCPAHKPVAGLSNASCHNSGRRLLNFSLLENFYSLAEIYLSSYQWLLSHPTLSPTPFH